jgi:hypothetical protein
MMSVYRKSVCLDVEPLLKASVSLQLSGETFLIANLKGSSASVAAFTDRKELMCCLNYEEVRAKAPP